MQMNDRHRKSSQRIVSGEHQDDNSHNLSSDFHTARSYLGVYGSHHNRSLNVCPVKETLFPGDQIAIPSNQMPDDRTRIPDLNSYSLRTAHREWFHGRTHRPQIPNYKLV